MWNADTKIGVIYGGFSLEREVSLRSGKNIYDALIRLGYHATLYDPIEGLDFLNHIDLAFLGLHGEFGEDGHLQHLLEIAGVAYTGCGAKASAICMNKVCTKFILEKHGIPTAKSATFFSSLQKLPSSFEYPVVVKPINQGSSLGVFILKNEVELQEKTQFLHQTYGAFMMEGFIPGQEVTVSVVEMPAPQVFPLLELRSKKEFYDYEAKYTAGLTEFILPAALSEVMTQKTKSLALKTFKALGGRGYARIDMRIHPEKGPMVLEMNTLPGMTDLSDLPAQAKAYGLSFDELIQIILTHTKKSYVF